MGATHEWRGWFYTTPLPESFLQDLTRIAAEFCGEDGHYDIGKTYFNINFYNTYTCGMKFDELIHTTVTAYNVSAIVEVYTDSNLDGTSYLGSPDVPAYWLEKLDGVPRKYWVDIGMELMRRGIISNPPVSVENMEGADE